MAVERLWPQVNSRVNYPLKRILYSLQERNVINMTCPTTQFCVSHVTIQVASVGMGKLVSAWNSHFIAGKTIIDYKLPTNYILGKGIPLRLSEIKYTIPVPTLAIPDTDVAVHEYEQQGGSLTHNSLFGNDPLRERRDLVIKRNQSFEVQIGSYEEIFTDVVSGNGDLLQRAILVFLSLTQRLAQLV